MGSVEHACASGIAIDEAADVAQFLAARSDALLHDRRRPRRPRGSRKAATSCRQGVAGKAGTRREHERCKQDDKRHHAHIEHDGGADVVRKDPVREHRHHERRPCGTREPSIVGSTPPSLDGESDE